MPVKPSADNPGRNYSNPVEMAEKVEAVAKMLLSGASRADIRRAGADPAGPFKRSTRQMDRLIEKATAYLAAEAAPDRPAMIGTAYRRYTAIFSACMRVQDYERALKAQDRIVSLFALQAPPPARTLNVNVDAAQLETLLSAIESSGLSAGDVFAAMIEELAATGAPDQQYTDLAETEDADE
jgi:hypothetical protein